MSELGRQLAAIMFVDMVGYTALMQRDEGSAMSSRARYRGALERAVAAHGGTTVHHYGDGALTIFSSAIAAVRCAVDMQQELRSAEPVHVRIGIHTGDIVRDAEGVYGDGVNIAARVQALAAPGSVLISGKVQDEVKNQADIRTRELGLADLKNVAQPVEIWSIDAPGLASPDPASLAAASPRRQNSVAVLPFVNLAADPDNEFFSDGISEEIINALTRIPGLKVTSRTSSFSFKGKQQDVREIAEALGVGTVLEGSVRRAGGRVRVTAQLIDAADGYHLFSQNYDRDLEDIFAIQDDIAAEIVRELQSAIGPQPSALKASDSNKVDVETYTTVLRARHLWNQWSPESALRSMGLYEEAIALDPSYAPAHSGLAAAYCYLGTLGRQEGVKAFARAEAEARVSLSLDPGNADAHVVLALVALFRDWDRGRAGTHMDRAAELNPGSGWVRHMRAMVLVILLDHEAALEEIELARDLDPLSQPILREVAQIHALSGHYGKALEQLERTLELGSSFRTALESKGWLLAWLGRYEEALEAFGKYAALSPSPYAGATQLGFTYGRMGRLDDAKLQLARLEERSRAEPGILLQMDMANVYLGMGDLARAFEWAERARKAGLGGMVFGLINAHWVSHRSDPRFKELVGRIGLWDGLERRWDELPLPG